MTITLFEDGRRIDLPAWNVRHGWDCCKEWTAPSSGVLCGCPICCHERSETCVWYPQDIAQGGKREFWGRKLVSEKTGLLAKENIVPGYPGGVDLEEQGPYASRAKLLLYLIGAHLF